MLSVPLPVELPDGTRWYRRPELLAFLDRAQAEREQLEDDLQAALDRRRRADALRVRLASAAELEASLEA